MQILPSQTQFLVLFLFFLFKSVLPTPDSIPFFFAPSSSLAQAAAPAPLSQDSPESTLSVGADEVFLQDELKSTSALIKRLSSAPPSQTSAQELKRLYGAYLSLLQQFSVGDFAVFPVTPRVRSGKLTTSFKMNLLGALQHRNLLQLSQSSDIELFKLIWFIEAYRDRLNPQFPDITLSVSLATGEKVPIFIEKTHSNDLFLTPQINPIGKGATKIIHSGIEYDTWRPVVKAEIKSATHLFHFRHEMRMLKALRSLSPDHQTHLSLPLSIGSNHAYFPLHSKDLFQLVEEDQLKSLQFIDRLRLLEQLTSALSTLHRIGMVHSDLKEENILVDQTPGKPIQLFLADFDLAHFPSEYLAQLGKPARKRPSGGSFPFFAPELLQLETIPDSEGGWIGSEPEEKIQLALKSDVFSLGTLAYDLLFPGTPNWYQPCLRLSSMRSRSAILHFATCQKTQLQSFLKKLSEFPREPMAQQKSAELIAGALQVDPRTRISSQEFLSQIQSIIALPPIRSPE